MVALLHFYCLFFPPQIHDRLKNVTSRVKVNWVAANGQDFRKEKKDKWEQSDRFRC